MIATGERRSRTTRLLPWGLLATCAAADVGALVAAAAGALSSDSAVAILCLVPAGVGTLIVSRLPRNPLGWILMAVALLFTLQIIAGGYLEAHAADPDASAVVAAAWFAAWAWVPAIGLGGAFLPLLFPTGKPPSPRWRFVAWLGAGGILINFVSLTLKPGPLDSEVPALNPVGIDGLGSIFDLTEALGGVLVVSAFILAVTSQVLRFRSAEGEERQQLKWFAFVGCLVALGMLFALVSTLVHTDVTSAAGDAGWFIGALSLGVGLPLAIGFAILRYRLYDIDWIISRTLVYVPLTALLAGTYIALTGVLRAVLSESTGNSDATVAFTTLVVVAMLTPAKNYLQEQVDRHFKESRDATKELDELTAAARSAAAVVDYRMFVQRFVEETVEAMQARGGSVRLDWDGRLRLFTHKDWNAPPAITVEIGFEGRRLGSVEIAARRNGRPYAATEMAALRRSVEAVANFVSLKSMAAESELSGRRD